LVGTAIETSKTKVVNPGRKCDRAMSHLQRSRVTASCRRVDPIAESRHLQGSFVSEGSRSAASTFVNRLVVLRWVGWWVICGDLPTGYVSAAKIKHPREAMRAFAERWRELARLIATEDRASGIRIGRPEDWPVVSR